MTKSILKSNYNTCFPFRHAGQGGEVIKNSVSDFWCLSVTDRFICSHHFDCQLIDGPGFGKFNALDTFISSPLKQEII